MKAKLLSTVAVLGTVMMFAGTASAAVILSTTPTWQNPQGAGVQYGTSGGGNAAYTDVRWGGGSLNNQSGLGFNPANPPSANIPVNTTFQLGSLRHYNNPVSGGVPTSVDLGLATTVAGALPLVQSFMYRFFIDETPNSTPCAYPSSTPCADKITFSNLDTSNFFSIGGIDYTIALTGFSTNGTTFSNSFISQEGATNTIGLYAIITSATPVPEPASLALFGMGLLGLGMARRRKAAL